MRVSPPEIRPPAARLRLRDVAIVAFAIALIVLGNIALVQAMDVALDEIVIASR